VYSLGIVVIFFYKKFLFCLLYKYIVDKSVYLLNMTFQMCKYVALCEEFGLSPESQPAVRSHPKQSNPCVFNTPRNYVP
jgi:hypothetical protein